MKRDPDVWEKRKQQLNECGAIRGMLSNSNVLDNYAKEHVVSHFGSCKDCQKWADKHNIEWWRL